jgi:hypothetical protein
MIRVGMKRTLPHRIELTKAEESDMKRRKAVNDEWIVETPNPPTVVQRDAPVRTVGPSDSSDTGADMVGIGGDDSSDRQGTGERASVDDDFTAREVSDIDPDRVVAANQAGLGGGLDQAEEAQLGITDEELDNASGDPDRER